MTASKPNLTTAATIIEAGEAIEHRIFWIGGHKVMLDFDLAHLYAVSTMRLNEQVKRNSKRFPKDFAFQLTRQELTALISQNAISKAKRGGRTKLPFAFTEHGAIMLASVLNSALAIDASIRVVRAFVRLRDVLFTNRELSVKLKEFETRLDGHDEDIQQLFHAIRRLLEPSSLEPQRRQIGFHVKDRGSLKTPTTRATL